MIGTQSNEDAFYQVKKQILDKLDVILQKVNLEIINSRHNQSSLKSSSRFKQLSRHTQDFTFIELSQFEQQISALFLHLDKVYQYFNSSFSSMYATHDQEAVNIINQLQLKNQKLSEQNQQLKNNMHPQIQLYGGLEQAQTRERQASLRPIFKQKIKNLQNLQRKQVQQLNSMKKWIVTKLKQFKFEMLEIRVEIISVMKQLEAEFKQKQIKLIKLYEGDKEKGNKTHCHLFGDQQMQIINELNQILKMC